MKSSELTRECKDDASKWAEAFIQMFPNAGVDGGTMLGWFANAIETAHDHRMSQMPTLTRDPDPMAATAWKRLTSG